MDRLRQWKLYRCEASGPGVSDDLADLARAEAISGVREVRGEGVLVLGPLMLIIECDLRQQSRGWSNTVLGVRESLEQFQFITFQLIKIVFIGRPLMYSSLGGSFEDI